MAARKLQQEIDRTLKKVDEGVVVFDQIWDKVRALARGAGPSCARARARARGARRMAPRKRASSARLARSKRAGGVHDMADLGSLRRTPRPGRRALDAQR